MIKKNPMLPYLYKVILDFSNNIQYAALDGYAFTFSYQSFLAMAALMYRGAS